MYHMIKATFDHVLKSECSNFYRTDIIELNFRLPHPYHIFAQTNFGIKN